MLFNRKIQIYFLRDVSSKKIPIGKKVEFCNLIEENPSLRLDPLDFASDDGDLCVLASKLVMGSPIVSEVGRFEAQKVLDLFALILIAAKDGGFSLGDTLKTIHRGSIEDFNKIAFKKKSYLELFGANRSEQNVEMLKRLLAYTDNNYVFEFTKKNDRAINISPSQKIGKNFIYIYDSKRSKDIEYFFENAFSYLKEKRCERFDFVVA